ncbi:MAG: PQQ-like beta-propeller repeat protein [Bryobacteraceae bacterium]|nr:PQQ-like beta-propeller repeat protein [Bryobacteraceae bacterium]
MRSISRRYFQSLLAGAPASSLVAQDWPQWRGPNRDGIAPASTSPAQWPEKLKQNWKVPVGEGHSAPVVGGNHVYQFARTGEREVAAAYDLTSGKKLWEAGYAAPYEMNNAATAHGKGPKATPVLAGGKLYTFGIAGMLTCFDAATGKKVWENGTSGKWAETAPTFGVAMSPILSGSDLIAHVGNDKKGALTAFDAQSGRVRWQWSGDGPAYASPVFLKTSSGVQIVTFSSEKFVGVDARDGSLQWQLPFTSPYAQNSVTPIVMNDVILFSGLSNPLTAVRVSGKTVQKLWENREVGMYMSSPVLAGNLLHGLTNRNKGQFFSLDPKSGKTVWTGEGRQTENAMLISRGDTVFALTSESELIVMRASPKGLEPLRKYTVANSPTWAHPVVLGNRVLIKDRDSLALWTA